MPNELFTDERGKIRIGDVTHSVTSVGVASTEIVPANPDRRWLLIQNGGGAVVSLRFDEGAAVLGEGFELAQGEVFEFPRTANNVMYRGVVNGIVAAATEDVIVSEA